MARVAVYVHNMGCKANAVDTDTLRVAAEARGYAVADGAEGADLVILNTCTVTDEADRQALAFVARTRRERPGSRIWVTGCGAEVAADRFMETGFVERVISNRAKGSPDAWWDGAEVAEWAVPGASDQRSDDRTRTFLKIQEGCDHYCTYCIIPRARGPSRSAQPDQVLERVKAAVRGGTPEVVLTGTNIGDTPDFSHLVERILRETNLGRLRLSSLDPVEIDSRLIALLASEERLMPHVHLSLQSAYGPTLRRMKRKYSEAQAAETLHAISEASTQRKTAGGSAIYVGMDVITGFVGETDAHFESEFARLEALPWARLHVFPYSEREGTAATRIQMDPVPMATRRARASRLRTLSMERLERFARENSSLKRVLAEAPRRGPDGAAWGFGHAENYLRVWWRDPSAVARGQCANMKALSLVRQPEQGEVTWMAVPEAAISVRQPAASSRPLEASGPSIHAG